MSVDQQFNKFNEKLQLLLKQYHRLQKDNERLSEELRQARTREAATLQKLGELEQQIMILKTGSGELSTKDRKDFEKKINQYLKEIDKCISHFSQ